VGGHVGVAGCFGGSCGADMVGGSCFPRRDTDDGQKAKVRSYLAMDSGGVTGPMRPFLGCDHLNGAASAAHLKQMATWSAPIGEVARRTDSVEPIDAGQWWCSSVSISE